MMEPSTCEDLKAFERRFTEVVSSYRPSTHRWRIVLALVSLCTAVGAWYWLRDPRTSVVPLLDSLINHPVFTIATLTLSNIENFRLYIPVGIVLQVLFAFSVLLFVFGIHKLVIAPQIITSRMRTVLSDFNMSCDDSGKLILKPRPNNKVDLLPSI